jgi:hypothetical protein
MYTELESMLLTYPNEKWNFKKLSMNPNISLKFIKDTSNGIGNPQFKWDYEYISKNPNLTEQFINENISNYWNLEIILENFNISVYYIKKIKMTNRILHGYYLSRNYTLTIDFVKNNLDVVWNWDQVLKNPSITELDIKYNPQLPWKVITYHWDNNGAFIENNILYPECIDYKIQYNKKLKNDILNTRHEKVPIDLSTTCNKYFKFITSEYNGNLTLDIIYNHPNYNWDFDAISSNRFNYSYKVYSINIIKKWYKRLKMSQMYFAIAEILIIEQMKPDGKYIQQYIKNLG